MKFRNQFSKLLVLAIVIVLVVAGCKGSPTELPSPSPEATVKLLVQKPTEEIKTPHHTVVLISWDGARADLVYGLMEQGKLPNFQALADAGIKSEYAVTIDPSLTAAVHNSISTGAYPNKTGIVSNSYHKNTDEFYWYQRGFDDQLDDAEPIWKTASKAGLKTAAVFFVGGSPMHPTQKADITIGYGTRDAYSKQEFVSLKPANDWVNFPQSYSPGLEGKFNISDVGDVHLYVIDSTNDGQENYDRVLLGRSKEITEQNPVLGVGEWAPMIMSKTMVSGGDFLIQAISASEVTLFHSNIYHNNASPHDLKKALNEKFGFFPSGPDYYALENGWITPEDNLYLMERASLWMAGVVAWVLETFKPDLLLTWQDNFDSAGHNFLMVDPRQLDYSEEKAVEYRTHYERAGEIADKALGIMLNSMDLERTTIMLVSDHGMAPIHTKIYINTLLQEAGLLALDGKNYVVGNKTKAFGVASGGAVNVYINLKDHELSGTVSKDEYKQIQDEIYQMLVNLKDPKTGEPVFQKVLKQDRLASLHLDHINSGDIFAQANVGYVIDGWRGNENLFETADYYGQHGYDSSLPEMRSIFIASGKGVGASGKMIPPVSILDYAATIARIFGFSPHPSVSGSPIEDLVGP